MDAPLMMAPRAVAPDTQSLTSYLPVPGFGVLPVNAFVIHSAQPVLVDTGLGGLREDFMRSLRSAIAPEELRWIWVTHTDPDHVGNLVSVLAEAPNARLVTTFLGMGKLSLLQVPLDRVYLLNPGQRLDVGDRHLVAVSPPCFDAPETTGLFDTRTRALFSADCFGALMQQPADSAQDIPAVELCEGLLTWANVDAPWLGAVDQMKFNSGLDGVRRLEPSAVLSSHLPPAVGMTDTLLSLLATAPSAPRFVGPDQAALEQAMAAAPVQT